MSIEHHNRLDQVLHAEEYLGMECGSLGYIAEKVPGGTGVMLKVGGDGQPVTEKKYCGSDCPTLIAAHRAA